MTAFDSSAPLRTAELADSGGASCSTTERKVPLRPLLRWAGSKRQIVPTLIQLMPPEFGRYVEPFVGSGSLFFAIRPTEALLSDTNYEVMNFYAMLQKDPVSVHREANSLRQNGRSYLRVRRQNPAALDSLQRAVRFYYLNRLCFNGVYRVNQLGEFNVPMGRKIPPFPSESNVIECSAVLRPAQLSVSDYKDAFELCRPGDLLYADPPYNQSGRHRGEYGIEPFTTAEVKRLTCLLAALTRRGVYVILSYPPLRSITSGLKGWRRVQVPVMRNIAASTSARGKQLENLFLNF